MKTRTFEGIIRVTVVNHEATEKTQMKFNTADLATILEDLVVIDLNTEEYSRYVDEGSYVQCVTIDWNTIKELKKK